MNGGMVLQETVVKFDHITMKFPGVLANDDICLDIKKGEIFALVGENGAGKSTLMNVLYGIYEPTGGTVYVKGKKVTSFSPRNAIDMGIGMVHQHFMLVPSFTVAQNIVLSQEPRKIGVLFDSQKAEAAVRNLSNEFGLKVDPSAVVRELSVGLQQRVEILKALYRGSDILILDEPTAILTPQETDELFAMLKKIVREKGMTVIIITHKLYEVMAISDRVGVMRQGRLMGVEETKNVNERILASMMVGREVIHNPFTRTYQPGKVAISVKDLVVNDNRGLKAVKGVSFEVRGGEVLGIAAIEGNGQSELLEAITGLRKIVSGDVMIMDNSIKGKTPGEIRRMGLAHIPEDRIATGVSSQADIADNLLVGKHKSQEFTRFGFHMRKSAVTKYAQDIFKRYDIRAAGINTRVGSLSGGNMQKVVIAREFSFETPVLIISQPTRGLDIGAIEFIHSHIMEKRNKGCAILLCSADLDEVLRLSDRIITIYEGKITGEFMADEITREQIGYYMTGDRSREDVNDAV